MHTRGHRTALAHLDGAISFGKCFETFAAGKTSEYMRQRKFNAE
jgi:hypothetical protein